MNSPLHIALIGAGNMGQQHQHLKSMTDATVCAVADSGPQAAGLATGVPVLVGHHRRHNPLIVRAHELIHSGALGSLTGSDAARTQALIEAIREAAETGRACSPALIEG